MPNTKKLSSAVIWFDACLGRYRAQFSYQPSFVRLLKTTIPAGLRRFHPDTKDWSFDPATSGLEYDSEHRQLCLRSQRRLQDVATLADERNVALQRLAEIPDCLDAFGARAVWDAAAHAIVASGPFRDVVPIWSTGPDVTLSDQTMGFDGVLYLAESASGNLQLIDRRER